MRMNKNLKEMGSQNRNVAYVTPLHYPSFGQSVTASCIVELE
jgi:hypothetical protein